MSRQRAVLVVLAVVALAGLLTVATWVSMSMVERSTYGPQMIGGSGSVMPDRMGRHRADGAMHGGMVTAMGDYVLPGNGVRVDSLEAARQRAQVFADRWQLRAGEVMEFDNGFYAELDTTQGQHATEVLIDRETGAVQTEYGPAMMWNTRYGMHPGQATAPMSVSRVEAARIAQRWLDDHRRGLIAQESEQFPGYYTLHTTRGGEISGMISVNAYTGTVWYHTWHGGYIALSER
jgi:hypothetical protein